MRTGKAIVSFVLVFCIMAITVVCAAVAVESTTSDISYSGESTDDQVFPELSAAKTFKPRFEAPKKTSTYYYSDNNIFYKYGYGMPN